MGKIGRACLDLAPIPVTVTRPGGHSTTVPSPLPTGPAAPREAGMATWAVPGKQCVAACCRQGLELKDQAGRSVMDVPARCCPFTLKA